MDDSALYTGVDGEPQGVFGNEVIDGKTKELMLEQRQLVAELTPKLQKLIDTVDAERAVAIQFISDYVDNSADSDEVLRGELKAAARYRKYLDELKTKFALDLNEAKERL